MLNICICIIRCLGRKDWYLNTKFTYVSYTPGMHSLRVILEIFFSIPTNCDLGLVTWGQARNFLLYPHISTWKASDSGLLQIAYFRIRDVPPMFLKSKICIPKTDAKTAWRREQRTGQQTEAKAPVSHSLYIRMNSGKYFTCNIFFCCHKIKKVITLLHRAITITWKKYMYLVQHLTLTWMQNGPEGVGKVLTCENPWKTGKSIW